MKERLIEDDIYSKSNSNQHFYMKTHHISMVCSTIKQLSKDIVN